MTNNDLGKFCPFCQTDVLDFTNLSDTEVMNILRHTSGKVCGRFRQSQLERPLLLSPKQSKSASPRYYKMLAAVLLLSAAPNIQAQTDGQLSNAIQNKEQVIQSQVTDSISPAKENTPVAINNKLTGNIFDQSGKILEYGASIIIKGTQVGTMTDADGSFSLTIPDALITNDEISFIISSLGYEEVIFKTKANAIPRSKDFYLLEDKVIIGEVIIVSDKYSDPIYDKKARNKK